MLSPDEIAQIAAIVNPMRLPSKVGASAQIIKLETGTERVNELVEIPPSTIVEVLVCDPGDAVLRVGSAGAAGVPIQRQARIWGPSAEPIFEELYLTHLAHLNGRLWLRCSMGTFMDRPDLGWPMTDAAQSADLTLPWTAGIITDAVAVAGLRSTGYRLGVLLYAPVANVNELHFAFLNGNTSKIYADLRWPLQPGEWFFQPLGNSMVMWAVQKTNAADLHLYKQEVGHEF